MSPSVEVLKSAFREVAEIEKITYHDPIAQLLGSALIEESESLDKTGIQESWAWRNTAQARKLACLLIDDQGKLKKGALHGAVEWLQGHLHCLGPERDHDSPRFVHLLATLEELLKNERLTHELARVGRPSSHKIADQLIRETLLLPQNTPLADAHAQRAALAALLTRLRQNVGSCFATAPAILIQQEQPAQFLSDVGQLLGTGMLKRVVAGEEYAVPLSGSWGMGDLKRPFFGQERVASVGSALGFLVAFEAAGLIEKKASAEEKERACSALLATSVLRESVDNPFRIFNPEEVIQSVLLAAFSLSKEDLVTHEIQRTTPLAGELLVIPGVVERSKGSVGRFQKAFALAKGAFKSVTDCALLKAWEFSLASLSEGKADFAKWNLYASLGFSPDEVGGVGGCLQELLQDKIARVNEEIEECQSRYDHLFAHAQALEGRARRAGSDRELGWVQAEYNARKLEIHRVLTLRDEAYEKGRKLAGLLPFLAQFYAEKFKEYFQEIYDAEMQDVTAGPYDDSPAGFRLLYKHGRTNTALWTSITSADEYLQALGAFFVATEIELSRLPEMQGMERDLGELVSAILLHIKKPAFLESSFHRLAHVYREPFIKDPLSHLDRVQRKPWAYISGGTMSTLIACYYSLPQKPKEVSRWVENPTELLVFFLDTLKELPLSVQERFRVQQEASLLAFSPTHAFLCKPGWLPFRKGWESDAYTYTWARDYWIEPQHAFLAAQRLDPRQMDALLAEITIWIPEGYRAVFQKAFAPFTYPMPPPEFRSHVLQVASYEGWLRTGNHLERLAEEIDGLLFSRLPYFPEYALEENLMKIFQSIEELDPSLLPLLRARAHEEQERLGRYRVLNSRDLRNYAQALLIHVLQRTRCRIDYPTKILEAMRRLHLAYPAPILFADTNWVKNTFGFVVNPGTDALELWRFDPAGGQGRPISAWKRYLDGTEKKEWGLYISPKEYSL